MYSVVLATMLTAGAQSPDFCFRSCHGCSSCSGCYGCYSSCYGCWGSCMGCSGCWMNCSGCSSSCHSYWGCYSSCHSCYGCSGCFSGCYSSCYSCYSCSGCYSGCTGCVGCVGAVVVPSTPTQKSSVGGPATVVVSVPSDATLLVDGQETKVSGPSHTFSTPALQSGQSYYYNMTVKAQRQGQTYTETQRVVVRAGETSKVEFTSLVAETAAPATVKFVLPAEAKLYVNDQLINTQARKSFETPKLNPGQTYHYTVKAELSVDGKTRSETQQVAVEAGKEVTVEFSKLKNELSASR